MNPRLFLIFVIGPAALILLLGCTAWPRALTPSPAPAASPGPPPMRLTTSPLPTATQPPSPTEVELPFDVIEHEDLSAYYHDHPGEPNRLFLIRSPAEAASLGDRVWPAAQRVLASLDYTQYFAVALFRGKFRDTGYDVTIERVVRRGDTLVVHARYRDPNPFYSQNPMNTAPHMVIRVRRDSGPLDAANLLLQTVVVTPTMPPR